MRKVLTLITKVSTFAMCAIILTSCEGSRTKRMYDTYKGAYEDYERTGDPTTLIILIVAGLLLGGIWAWKKIKDNR